jgi:hypothetical protein
MIRETGSHVSINGIGSKPLPGPPIVDGLLWRNEWKAPCEGPLTLLWKIALANCLTPRELYNRLFGKHLLVSDSSGLHGRTLLAPSWMIGAEGGATKLGQMIRCGGLDMASETWASVLASDEHIRYCKACMTDGYQSVYCQIDAIRTCPVHSRPLLESCTVCGAPTPRYVFSSLTMSDPYRCNACGELLGERLWLPTAQGVSRIYNDKKVGYLVLEQWMSSVENLDLSWPQLSSWQSFREEQQGEIERRIAVLEILAQLVTLPLKSEYLCEPAIDISMCSHRAVGSEPIAQIKHVDATDKWNTKRNAYAAIRRHIRRILMHHHRGCLSTGYKSLHIEWNNEVLRPIAPVCPLVFAYFLWRHHFESNVDISPRIEASNRKLSMREEALAWPVDWELGISGWCTFVIMSFYAFAQVAKEWCEQIDQLTAPYDKANIASLMQLLTDFRIALSPRYMTWTSRVTAFSIGQIKPSNERYVVIVGPAGRLRDMLLQRPCAVTSTSHLAIGLKAGSIQSHLVLSKFGNLKKPKHTDNNYESEFHVAPLDRIKVPPELDGHALISWRTDPGHVEAKTDVEIVRIWLKEYEGNSSTFRSYQSAVERLINWAVLERRKPLSALDDSDLVAFEAFLADPQPHWRWISPRGTARSAPNWTPFVGPLSPKTRLQTLTIIRVMFDWLGKR